MGRWGRVGNWDSILVIECRIFLFSKEEQCVVLRRSCCCGLIGDVKLRAHSDWGSVCAGERAEMCETAESVGLQLSLNHTWIILVILIFLLFAPETKFEFWRVIKGLVANSSSKTNLKLFLLPWDIGLSIEGPCAVNEIIVIVQRTKLILSKRPVANRRE